MTHARTYTVSTIAIVDDRVTTCKVADCSTKAAAMKIAKRLALAKDCQTYGPSSLAYVGRDLTAVVAW